MPGPAVQTDAIDYLNPDVPDALPWVDLPVVEATPDSLEGYGLLVDDHEAFPIEIVTWPAQGWRPVDPGTGNEAGTTSGIFHFWWEGELMFGRNDAVDDQYLLGWSRNPGEADRDVTDCDRSRVLLWHANYHPDGGQLFFPLDASPFVAPLALPGDSVKPGDFKAFRFSGKQGLYIHPSVWHEAIFPLNSPARFYDEQGRVHARVSCNFATEFGVFLSVPLAE
mgnify:FL=1